MDDHSTLVRIAVLSRLLAQALEETEIESEHLGQELAALRERAERELDENAGQRATTHGLQRRS
jgi:hypothetical protein